MFELRLTDGTVVSVHPFPRTASFVDDLRTAWSASLGGSVGQRPADPPGALETALRRWYPRATVQPQEATAALTDWDVVWYVFRDGRVRRASDRREALQEALHRARATEAHVAETLRESEAALDAARHPAMAHGPAPRRS